MKKITIITLCLLALGSTVFAQNPLKEYDLSVGFGAVYGYINDSWKVKQEHRENYGWLDGKAKRHQLGVFVFFGNRYTEFNSSLRWDLIDDWTFSNGETKSVYNVALSVGAYGKYPIPLGTLLALIPTIGVDFDANESIFLWCRGGLGLDIFIDERIFFRIQALYGYGFQFLSSQGYEKITPGHAPFIKWGGGWKF